MIKIERKHIVMKRLCLWFTVFSLFLVLLPGKALGAVDFPNTSTNGLLGFAGNAKNEKGISKTGTTGGKNGQIVYIQSVNDLKTHLGLAPVIKKGSILNSLPKLIP